MTTPRPTTHGHLTPGHLAEPAAPTRARDRLAAFFIAPPVERHLEERLQALGRRLTRTGHIAIGSPKGGVGKTTCALLVADRLAASTGLRCLVVDADPGRGTLGSLPPEHLRCEHSLADLVGRLDRLDCAAALRPYVSLLPSGLHVLASHPIADAGSEDYLALLAALDRFYEVVLLDLGAGVTDSLARQALERADHTMLITTPELVTVDRVLHALDELVATIDVRRTTLVLNQAPTRRRERELVETILAAAEIAQQLSVPYDARLAARLDAGAYRFTDLTARTRLAITQLALSVGEAIT